MVGDDPEIGYQKIDRALAVILDAIHDARGFVARIQGDGVMALFGAPLAQEHHALRACDAALAIQTSLTSLASEGLRVRVGLNSGEVVVGTIRNDLSVDYDAVGQTVHLASRMEEMAEPGGILLTSNTMKLVRGFVAVEPRGRVDVLGFTDKVPVYVLQGRQQVRTRWEAAHETRTLSAFVGRERELGLLADALAAAADGQAHVIHILGDAGVGKSRLVYEFLRTLEDAKVDVQVTGALRETRSTPYRPITLMLRDWAGLDDGDGDGTAVDKLRHFLTSLCPDLDSNCPALRTLLGLSVPEDEGWAQLDPHLRRRRMLDTIRNLVLARARTRPLVLVVEDVHWLDRESLAALDHLSLAMARSTVLLVVTARFAQEPVWKPKAENTVILLNSFGSRGAGALLDHLLGDDASLTQLKWRLLAAAEGTPMFLEQMVEVLAEEGLLRGEPGSYRFEGLTGQLRIPDSIQSVIAARIDRLPATERRLLQIAAVIGRAFPQTLLAGVGGLSGEKLMRSVIVLRDAGFLHDTMDGSGRLAFTHALIQEVAYAGLLKQQRRDLHAQVLRLLEAQSGGEAYIEDLARQAFLGSLWQKAIEFAREAGAKANAHSAYHEAAQFFEMALAAACQLDDSAESRRCRAEINVALSTTYPPLGEITRGYEALERAEALYESLSELDQHLEIGVYKTAYYSVRGTLEQALRTGEDVVRRAKRLKRPAYIVAAKVYLAEAALFAGNFPRVVTLIEPHLGALRGPLRRRRLGATATISVDGLGLLAMAYAHLGRFDEALSLGAEVARIEDEETCRPFDQGLAHFYYGFARTHRGQFGEAMESLERAAAACEQGDLFMLKPWLDGLIAFSHARSGRTDVARPMFEHAAARARQLQLVVFEAMAIAGLAVTALIEGNLDEADRLARMALQLAADNGYQGVAMWENRVLGLIAAARGGDAETVAETHFLCSIAIGEELGMKPDIALSRLFLGRHYAECGRRDDALRELEESEDLLRALGMDFWLPHLCDLRGRLEIGDPATVGEQRVA